MALLKKLEQLFYVPCLRRTKSCFQLFQQAVGTHNYTRKKPNISLKKKLLITFVALHRNRCYRQFLFTHYF